MPVSSSHSEAPAAPEGLYRAVWRWHLYAGLAVAPILLVLATTGLVMLLRAPIETALYGEFLTVTPRPGRPQPPSAQLAAVEAAFPDAEPIQFVPPRRPDAASEFTVVPATAHRHGGGHDHGAPTYAVFVDPYDARVLGTLDPARTPYGWANAIHGSLLLGAVGDGIVEIVAGLAVLLVGTGLFLAWPRGPSWRVVLLPRASIAHRTLTRGLHGALGFWLAVPLLFFLLSGLTWTGVWGERLVQAWNTVALERGPASVRDHGSLDRGDLEEVPWALEQTPIPVSDTVADPHGVGSPPDLDHVVAIAGELGFEHFRVHLPRGHDGVWTVSASTMANDTDDPRDERFVHLDRHSGRVLTDVGFADYSSVARFMAAGVPFHQGDLGPWNVAFNAVVCLAVIALVGLATVLFWQRRPGLARFAPPRPDRRTWWFVVVAMLTTALAFPLTAAAIVTVVALDVLIVSPLVSRVIEARAAR